MGRLSTAGGSVGVCFKLLEVASVILESRDQLQRPP